MGIGTGVFSELNTETHQWWAGSQGSLQKYGCLGFGDSNSQVNIASNKQKAPDEKTSPGTLGEIQMHMTS